MVAKLREKYKSDDFDIELRRTNMLDKESIDCPGGKNLIHINVDGKYLLVHGLLSWMAKMNFQHFGLKIVYMSVQRNLKILKML